MRLLTTLALAAILTAPLAASAAELAVPRHAARAVAVHKVVRLHVARPHWGYYFYRWGWRYGPPGPSWLGSRFVFADAW